MPIDNYGEVEITPGMLADKSKRFVNFLIDYIICFILTILLGFFGNWLYDSYGFTGLTIGDITKLENNPFRFNLMHFFVCIVFYGLFESITMRSPGKFITGTKVVMSDGTKPGQTAIFIRTLCRRIPFEFISFLGPYAIGWHDMFSKTRVVYVYDYERALRDKQIKNNTDNSTNH